MIVRGRREGVALESIERVDAARPLGKGGTATIRLGRNRLDLTLTIDDRIVRLNRAVRGYPRLSSWLFACVLIYLVWQRCPTVISHAAFWAEDGWVWYPQCYAVGWRCILIDHTAYMQTISRLVALLSLEWPLASAPLVFAWSALLMQAAPSIFLASPRMAAAIPVLRLRVALALLLVAIPGMSEVYVNLTNAQWHLALLAFLVLTASPAATWPQRGFDTLVLIVSGLSGPFSPVLAPVALLWYWRQPGRSQAWRLAITAATASVQLSLVLLHHASREASLGIGWSLPRLMNIVDIDIIGVAALGRQRIIDNHWTVSEGWLSSAHLLPMLASGCILCGASVLAIIAIWRGPWILRAFLIFTALEFGTSLTNGLSINKPLWANLELWIGMRYYFHPVAAWLAILVVLVCDRNPPLRSIGLGLAALTLVFALPSDWQLPKHQRTTFSAQATLFSDAPPGTVMRFPVAPLHDMTLIKH